MKPDAVINQPPLKLDAPGGVAVQRMVRPFVVIAPYQFDGDVAFGVWEEKFARYLLGDGDAYNLEELSQSWPDAELLTWSELEKWLRRPNTRI